MVGNTLVSKEILVFKDSSLLLSECETMLALLKRNPEITAPYIPTTEGEVQLQFVSDATKLVLVAREVSRIKTFAIETAENVEGANMNKIVESLIATSPILANISAKTEFSYI